MRENLMSGSTGGSWRRSSAMVCGNGRPLETTGMRAAAYSLPATAPAPYPTVDTSALDSTRGRFPGHTSTAVGCRRPIPVPGTEGVVLRPTEWWRALARGASSRSFR